MDNRLLARALKTHHIGSIGEVRHIVKDMAIRTSVLTSSQWSSRTLGPHQRDWRLWHSRQHRHAHRQGRGLQFHSAEAWGASALGGGYRQEDRQAGGAWFTTWMPYQEKAALDSPSRSTRRLFATLTHSLMWTRYIKIWCSWVLFGGCGWGLGCNSDLVLIYWFGIASQEVDDMDLGAHIDTLRALKLQTSYHPLDNAQMVNSRTVSCRSRKRPQSSTLHS